jgi:hypothetical protein
MIPSMHSIQNYQITIFSEAFHPKIIKMRKPAVYATFLLALLMFYSQRLAAQNGHSTLIPESVRLALTAKYPVAEVKKWSVVQNEYVAKTKQNGHRHFVYFNQNGNWIKTETKLSWPWHIPKPVKDSYNKCIYKNWNIYGVKIIDTPTGQYYRILVDDRNHPVDIMHQSVFTRERSVVFKADGGVVDAGNPEDKGTL